MVINCMYLIWVNYIQNTIRIYFLSGNMAELTHLCVGFENLIRVYNYGKALIEVNSNKDNRMKSKFSLFNVFYI